MRHAVLCPFTRLWAVDRFFDSVAESDIPIKSCHFIAYIDHNSQELVDAIEKRLAEQPWAKVTVHVTGEAPPDDNSGTAPRRIRQAKMRQDTVSLIPKCDKLLLLEDDTLVPRDAWKRLNALMRHGYDWASGFEVGRWKCPCAGIWKVDPGKLTSMMPGEGTDCDATGVYLVLTTREVYATMPWDVYDNEWGQDVTVTWLLKQAGHKLGVDWDLRCVHMGPDRDWITSEVIRLRRKVGKLNPVHYDQHRQSGEPKPRSHYTLGKDVVMDGTFYRKGSRITRETAQQMHAQGHLLTVIP